MAAVTLDAFDLLQVSGADAKKFLQGQVTCNVDLLSPQRSLEGAICNVKGRVIGDFRLLEQDGACYLSLPAGMGPLIEQVLNRYIVFSKASCQQVSQGVRCLGLLGEVPESLGSLFGALPANVGDTVSQGGLLLTRICGRGPRYELWQLAAEASLATVLDDLAPTADEQAWQLEDIHCGIAHITPETSGQHLPEVLNYDLSGVINFKKGCYTGQEIVARMHYRGKAKKRLFHVVAEYGGAAPRSIDCLLAGGENPETGELVSQVTDRQDRWHGLVILPAAAADASSQLFLDGDRQRPAGIESLPYMV